MAFDVLSKKYFTLLVLVLIGVAAYFQAAGIGALTGAALDAGPGAGVTPAVPATAEGQSQLPPKTAEAILSRNPFDSVTGPLVEQGSPSAPLSAPPITDPLRAPACPGIHVHIVTEADDPAWSRAALQRDGDDKPEVYRVGDTVGDQKIAYIGYNPRVRSPAVWLESGSSLCQALLFSDSAKNASPGSAPPAPAPRPAPRVEVALAPPGKGSSRKLTAVDAKLASKIRKLSDTQVRVSPAAVDDILKHSDQLMPESGVLPESVNGQVKGIRIFGIRSNTLLGKLGLESGDRVESVGGVPVTSPDKAIEGYDKMRGAGSLRIQVTRRGQPVTINLQIR